MRLVLALSLLAIACTTVAPIYAGGAAADKSTIGDKTLVAWVTPANLTQRGGSVLTLERGNGAFDGIVFGEIAPGKWMAGSNMHLRTQKPQATDAETADPKTLVQIAIVYKGKQITIYRDGKVYADYTAGGAERFDADSRVLIGLRHQGAMPENRAFVGSIDDARIYGVPLSAEQIAELKPNQPSTIKPIAWWDFEEGRAVDKMGRFPATTLVGDARIAGGRLHLDKEGAHLLATASPTSPQPIAKSGDTDASNRAHREKMLKDPYRAGYHFTALEGRCMPFDPNGAIFWKGRYHLFYIFQDGRGHNWGHVSSTDLVHWRHHPTTLLAGMFSGNCFVNKEGRPTMCHHNTTMRGNVMVESLDDNLDTWQKPKPITPKNDPLSKKFRSWDPFGWFENDHYYAIFGGTHPGIAKADAIDGEWKYVGDLFAHPVKGVDINEDVSCADLFKLGNTHMLLCISHRLGARYYLGDWKNEQFHPKFHERMSWVDNSYFAPRSLKDEKGRRIMWAWIFDGPGFHTRNSGGWSGTMSLPRVLSLADDGTLRMNPIEELEKLRYDPKKLSNVAVPADGETPVTGISGNSIEINVEMAAKDAKQFGVKVCCSPMNEEQTLIYYDAVAKKLKVDTSKSSLTEGAKTTESGPFELKADEPLKLRIFVDKSVVEVFANGRQAVMRRIYPSRPDSVGVSLYSVGGPANASVVEGWQMMPSNPY